MEKKQRYKAKKNEVIKKTLMRGKSYLPKPQSAFLQRITPGTGQKNGSPQRYLKEKWQTCKDLTEGEARGAGAKRRQPLKRE